MNGFQMNGRVVDPQKQSIIVELLLMKKTQARLQQKVVRRGKVGCLELILLSTLWKCRGHTIEVGMAQVKYTKGG